MHTERYRVFGRDGEFDHKAICELIRRGEITSFTDLALVGEEQWKGAGFYPDLQYYLGIAAQKQQRFNTRSTARAISAVQLLIVAGLVLAGLICLAVSARDLTAGLASRNWPTAEAQLIDSDLIVHTTRSKGRTRRHYELAATYTYTVEGQRYFSRGIAFGTEWMRYPHDDLRQIRNANPLLAHYDPQRPSTAVLHNGVSGSTIVLTAMGIAAIGLGLLTLLVPAVVRRFGDRITAMSRYRLGART